MFCAIICNVHDTTDHGSLRGLRLRAQLLAEPATEGVDQIVSHLLAVQAQDLRSARLALRARSRDLTARDVDEALTTARTLVVAWLGRGTLHLVHRDDYPWLLALTAPRRFRSNERRLRQEEISPDDAARALAIIETALGDEGPLSREDLGGHLETHGISTAGQAVPHLLMRSCLLGISVLGPVAGTKQAFALTEDWLGTRPPSLPDSERAAALTRLARRYRDAHAPATPVDLAGWIGLPLRDARIGFESIDESNQRPGPAGSVSCRLLPSFDPYLLGWKDRSFLVSHAHRKLIHPGGGVIKATIIHRGEVIGTWNHRRKHRRMTLALQPFARLDEEVARALDADAEDVARFEALALSR